MGHNGLLHEIKHHILRELGGGGGGGGGGQVVRWCWVNFQCRGVLLIWIRVEQGPTAVGACGGCLDIFFSRLSLLFSFFLSLGDGQI